MRLYFNDVVVSRHASAEQIEAALARFQAEPEAALELRRNARDLLRAERAVIDGETVIFLERRVGSCGDHLILEPGEMERVFVALREYLGGKVPHEFKEEILEPDCPLCAMLARQQAPARGSC